MYEVIEDFEAPVLTWAPWTSLDEQAKEQAYHLSKLPFVFQHISLMPDCHGGFGAPIGTVLATKGYILPSVVGNDIGCGMLAVKTDVDAGLVREPHDGQNTVIQAILGDIRRTVPVGNGPGGQHKQPIVWRESEREDLLYNQALVETYPDALQRAVERSAYQAGTLGGGNHFIEFDEDQDGKLWIMLHSGSRAMGKMVCDYFEHRAQVEMERYFSSVPKEWKLAFLPTESADGIAYKSWMELCLAFSSKNKHLMMRAALNALEKYVAISETEWIETHHNYASWEHHYGEDVLVHRKGACAAYDGEPLIIPGSMETHSYICAGKQNRESFASSSHGAGRKMSRNQAKKQRATQDVVESLKKQRIALSCPSTEQVVEEGGHAYHAIEGVIKNEEDLVEVKFTLRPIGCIKG